MPDDVIEGFCPECNRMSALQVRSEAIARAPRQLMDQLEPGEDGLRLAHYSIAFCPQCESPFFYVEATSEPSDFVHRSMLFPCSGRRDLPNIPRVVRKQMDDARSCFETGIYGASVLMCRRTLEALCSSLAARGANLAIQLRSLEEEGRIERRMYEWAERLRLIGNEAAHDFEREFSQREAANALRLVEALLLYTCSVERSFEDLGARRGAPGRKQKS